MQQSSGTPYCIQSSFSLTNQAHKLRLSLRKRQDTFKKNNHIVHQVWRLIGWYVHQISQKFSDYICKKFNSYDMYDPTWEGVKNQLE